MRAILVGRRVTMSVTVAAFAKVSPARISSPTGCGRRGWKLLDGRHAQGPTPPAGTSRPRLPCVTQTEIDDDCDCVQKNIILADPGSGI